MKRAISIDNYGIRDFAEYTEDKNRERGTGNGVECANTQYPTANINSQQPISNSQQPISNLPRHH